MTWKSIAAGFAGMLAVVPQVAAAADMVLKAPRAQIYTPYNWTGSYFGINAGYGLAQSSVRTSVLDPGGFFLGDEPASVAAAGRGVIDLNGFTGGVQTGYNWQVNRLVYGIEADFNYLDAHSSRIGQTPDSLVAGNTFNVRQEVRADWIGTLRPRIGYAFDNFMIYATGGGAAGHYKSNLIFFEPVTGNTANGATSAWKIGWTAGGGLEYGLNRSWTLKGEYLYTSFETASFNTPASAGGTLRTTADLDVHLIRAGLNYRF